MRRILTSLLAPAALAVPLSQLKDQLRITTDAQDDFLTSVLKDSISWVEEYTGRSLMYQQWELAIDTEGVPIGSDYGQGSYIPLDRAPLYASLIPDIKYYSLADVEQTMPTTNYWLDAPGRRVVLKSLLLWPSDLRPLRSIVVAYYTGYSKTDQEKIPRPLRRAIVELAAFWFTNPSAVLVGSISKELEFGIKELCGPFSLNLEF
jgi:uncharacterized phiE125 gp8 family phage protein